MTVGLEPGTAAVAIVWRAPGTHQALALSGDDVWFWTFASPERRWADVTGTFRTEATPAERAALTALSPGDDEPGGPALQLTVGGTDGARRGGLGAGPAGRRRRRPAARPAARHTGGGRGAERGGRGHPRAACRRCSD